MVTEEIVWRGGKGEGRIEELETLLSCTRR